jgi:hypothetical protein
MHSPRDYGPRGFMDEAVTREGRYMRRARLLAPLAAACVGVAAVVSGCGDERSAEAYCRAFYAKAAPIRQSYVDQNKRIESDPFGSIVKLLQAPGDLESIFDSMVDHAPDEIKSDTVIVRDSFGQMQDTMGEAVSNPLGALGQGLVSSLSSGGAFERVNAYLTAHCPPNSDLAQEYIEAAD